MTFNKFCFRQKLFNRVGGFAFTLMIAGVILAFWQSRSSAASNAALMTPDSVNFQQVNKLTASDGQAQDRFGGSVAVSGDGRTIAIGAPGDNLGASSDQGSVYIYERNGAPFVFSQQLFTSGGSKFGTALDLDGDSMIVGSPGEQSEQGAVYIFVKQNGSWQQQQRLVANDGAAEDHFGFTVSISGNTVLVGAYGDDINGQLSQGSAYLFTRTGATWSQQQKLTASDGLQADVFGFSVALDGDTAAIGMPYDQVGEKALQGSVYVFRRPAVGAWYLEQKLTANDGSINDSFGNALALEGETLLVGAWLDSSLVANNHGSAYVFQRTGDDWSQQAKLVANDGTAADQFGNAVALSGDTAIVGAYHKNVNGTNFQGATYTFSRNATVWSQSQRFTGNGGASSYMGGAVALAGGTLVSGAYGESNNKGAVYVYRPPNTAPSIAPQAVFIRQAGSAPVNLGVANVIDPDQAANTLQVLVEGAASATKNGVTVSIFGVTPNGNVFVTLSATCGASSTFFTLSVIDDEGALNNTIVQFNITADTPPTLGYGPLHFVNANGSLTINPTSGPSDNGTINFINLQNVTPLFTGSITVLPNGVVTIANAGPAGNYTLTIRAYDTCGLFSSTSFTLVVGNGGSISANDLQFYPLAHPVRLLDTRVGQTGCDS
ncbi:MAG TPA: FG-GAP repeat protein, partial [Blastocatellia bacterium]|nr:FG-GAP repeat protein [Blastocatellia bacterium]